MTSNDDGEQSITLDFRLMAVRYELYVLEEYHGRIEAQIASLIDMTEQKIRADIKDGIQNEYELEAAVAQLTADEAMFIPRLVRHPFLVSLYAVYEATVTEIAGLVREGKSVGEKLDDIEGRDFLDKARKYYECVPCITLTQDNASWSKVRFLADLRHVIAHTNGRIDMATEKRRDKIMKDGRIIVKGPGLMVVGANLLDEIFFTVKSDLEHLVHNYLEWDSPRERVGPPPQRLKG